MMTEQAKDKKWDKAEILSNLLWTAFGIIGGLNYYSKEEYLICVMMSLIGVLYAYKLIKTIIKK